MLMTNHKILLVDDDRDLLEMLLSIFQRAGYTDLLTASSGSEALRIWREAQPNLIVLDVMMPGCSGISACQQIRKKTMTPILFLTAKSQDADKVLGFSAGGDDYLVKPFSYSELTARVRAMVRRYREYGAAEAVAPASQRLEFGQVCILPETGEVRLCDESLALTDIEYRILLLLASNPKKIFSAQNIYESVWGEPYFYASNNTVMVHMRNLRRKLSQDGAYPDLIKTVWGRGYHIG